MNGLTALQAILLGALQGLTEFLPVSSSGHLALLQQLFGLHEPALIFDLLLHIATLFAVVLMYRRDIWALLTAWFDPWSSPTLRPAPEVYAERAPARRLGMLIIVANLPTAVIGLTFESTFERLFTLPWAVGLALIGTGTILWCVKQFVLRPGQTKMGIAHALLLGCVQGLAITPGISRSGSTIATALLCGIPRDMAARFSFLMSIPAILGATLLKSASLNALSSEQLSLIAAGMLSALIVGYVALRVLVRLVQQGDLWRFAFYCWCLGLGAILVSL
ncbi:MAG TPA: undecaprenyl-diphosphate phosphatase [Candidatus Entotheonella sp.]|jgi:undecaprenyl-diphosphatase